jgi:hypothetical protein
MRWMTAAAVAGVLLLVGCGATPPPPPSARALAAKMNCQILGGGYHFAGYDLASDLSLDGQAPGCLSGEVFTFPSQKAQADWMRLAGPAAGAQSGTLYPWFVTGNLWAVNLGDSADLPAVAAELHGKQVTF